MTRVLFVGQQPETVDYTDPTLPLGMNAKNQCRHRSGPEANGRTRMARGPVLASAR